MTATKTEKKTRRKPAAKKATKAKSKAKASSNGKHDKFDRWFRKTEGPLGDTWVERVARNIIDHREKLELTVPLAAAKFKVTQTLWYRVEKGTNPQTTARYIDRFAEIFGVDVAELCKATK